MTFLAHIERCNRHDLSQFRPWFISGRQAGWIHRDTEPLLRRRPDLFRQDAGGWHLAERLATPDQRSAAVEQFLLELRADGQIVGWRNEAYPVTPRLADPPVMVMERAAVPLFGVRAFGVHMTGFVHRSDGLHIWVPRRATDKETYPGLLDNTVAGGQPVGLTLYDNMIKECREEAGIPPQLAAAVRPVGLISYAYQSGRELKPDIQYCFDLELPADFQPQASDGEVESFELWPLEQVLARVRDTQDFKYNCNLVLIDFFLRHGAIAADAPDYFEIAAGLRRHIEGLVHLATP